MLTLYDAARCPYCARVRIVLAEKAIPYDAVEIDLSDRPAWLYTKNPLGKVPVLEEDGGFVLPESQVVMEYLEERYPEPPLWPADAAERALGRLWLDRFEDFAAEYYALRRGEEEARRRLDSRLVELDSALEAAPNLSGRDYGLADIGYFPWIVWARANLGIELDAYPSLGAWFDRLSQRPAVAAELELVSALH
ncbi:MAG: glutathione S-transferase family protein [Actinomycetota bacterium]|nr:glutathione S-transferase family protein [Actinomycetota bacterium]